MKSLLIATLIVLSFSARMAHAGSSHEGKEFDITVSPIGFTFFGNLSISQELALAYHVTDDDVVSIDYQYYPQLFDYSSSDWSRGSALGVFYQHYVGSSFNLKAGLSQGNYEVSKYVYDYPADYRNTFQARVTTLEGRIGNQWTWGSFTMGADWVGVSVPLLSTVTRDDGGFSNRPTSVFLRFVQFYLGVSF